MKLNVPTLNNVLSAKDKGFIGTEKVLLKSRIGWSLAPLPYRCSGKLRVEAGNRLDERTAGRKQLKN